MRVPNSQEIQGGGVRQAGAGSLATPGEVAMKKGDRPDGQGQGPPLSPSQEC